MVRLTAYGPAQFSNVESLPLTKLRPQQSAKLEDYLPKDPTEGRTAHCTLFSLSLAKSVFLVTDTAISAMPKLQLTGAAAKATGCAVGSTISLVSAGNCLRAGIERYGSIQGLVAEKQLRETRALAAYEAKKMRGEAAKQPRSRHACNFAGLNQNVGLLSSPEYGLVHLGPLPFYSCDSSEERDEEYQGLSSGWEGYY